MRKPINYLAVIEAVLRGENKSGWPDKTVIRTHAREMQRELNELREQVKLAQSQLELFNGNRTQQE